MSGKWWTPGETKYYILYNCIFICLCSNLYDDEMVKTVCENRENDSECKEKRKREKR